MAKTYCDNDDLFLPNGDSIKIYFSSKVDEAQRDEILVKLRRDAFDRINEEFLTGKTAIPAFHIKSLRKIESLMVLSTLLAGSYVQSAANTSEWVEDFKEDYIGRLERLKFVSSSSPPLAAKFNVGNGIILDIMTNDIFTKTEIWAMTALNSKQFAIEGEKSGSLPDVTVGELYPDKDMYQNYSMDYGRKRKMVDIGYPLSFTLVAGNIPFETGDRFEFMTYSSNKRTENVGIIGHS